jgi:hypothetical protein
MIRANTVPAFTVELTTDPVEIARMNEQHARFERNLAWYQAHIAEIVAAHRGKYVCVAGEELFVGDTPEEVLDRAKAAHPEDNGFYFHYIHRQKACRIYAHPWRLEAQR